MSKILVVLSNIYPDVNFLKTESKHFDKFNKIFYFEKVIGEYKDTIEISNNATYHKIDIPIKFNGKLDRLKKMSSQIFTKYFWKDFFQQKNKFFNKNIIENSMRLMTFIINSKAYAKELRRVLLANGVKEDDEIVFYAFRLHFHAGAAYFLKRMFKNSKTVGKGHGYDLYHYRWETGYIPMQKIIMSDIDHLFAISKHGENYMKEILGKESTNVGLSYMGAVDHGVKDYVQSDRLRIVSCSRIDPVKRIEKIFEAVENSNIPIHWTHFGGGPNLETYIERAKRSSNDKTQIEFLGEMNNEEVLQNYRKHDFDLFVNVSEYEGLPVSIMEAISFGIPVIATDVGGTSEIVRPSNGYLIQKDFTNTELIKLLEDYNNLGLEDKLMLRTGARNVYEESFNAKINGEKFIESIMD